jgi:hypothetical protein
MPFEMFPKMEGKEENIIKNFLEGSLRTYLLFTHKDENEIDNGSEEVRYLNKGISKNTQFLEEGFSAGEVYIFRYKAAIDEGGEVKVNSNGTPIMYDEEGPVVPRIGLYNKDTLGILRNSNNKYIFSTKFEGKVDDYVYYLT